MYCINNNENVSSKHGILELASAYYNYGGLCLYAKYGFQYSADLFGEMCFADYNNLPMIVDLRSQYGDQHECNTRLKDILINNRNAFDKPAICTVQRGKRQELMGVALNVQMFLQHNRSDYLASYFMTNNTTILYDVLYDKLLQSNTNIHDFVQSIESMSEETLQMYHEMCIKPPDAPDPEPPVTAAPRSIDEPMVKRLRTRRGGRRRKRTKRSRRA